LITVTFLKTSAVPSGNLPPIPSDENIESTGMWENTLLDTSEITESSEIQDQPHSPQLETLSMPPHRHNQVFSILGNHNRLKVKNSQKKMTIPVILY